MSSGYFALERLTAELTPTCGAEPIRDQRCTRLAVWGVRLSGEGSGLACDQCKTEIERATFTLPGRLEWVRL